MYFLLFTSLSSQFECTRPIYNQHFKQYYDAYVIPKYDEYVDPHVQEFVIPAYKQYGEPQIAQLQKLYAAHGQPQLEKLIKLYDTHLKDHVDKTITSLNEQVQTHVVPTVQNVQKELEPFFNNAVKNGTVLVKQLREQANVLAENWGVVCEQGIADMRVQIDKYSALARDETLKGLAKVQRASKEYANAALVNTEEYRQQASVKFAEVQSIVYERVETTIAIIQKQLPIIHEFLLEYNIDKIFSNIFEGIGRSIVWTGDLIGKVAAGRFCCAQSQIARLGNDIYELGLLAYNQVQNLIQN
ncbi:Oidioi.mRNA.OKI2018_I69.PAR.g12549.t1.cds [Oikopleura dioica]|uniref:Oidioi.mRNA.OKI2018_I69.PAR.g12549.t1.cds n=1 Tax=Oikopleura dioica TaxID=34765 RepID=A0ABN7S5D0_OIKDI|nr:Oidioi.mRNA.OKI2018_I69.PAR.g12549.t1.cds [Oikopleura dioica]